MKALIVDDEPLAHQIVLQYAEEVDFIDIVGQCYSATEALAFFRKQPVDLLFLDIQMPKLLGVDLLRVLDQKPLVIITSAYKEYALESFELDVCDYLLKPYRYDRFLKAVNKALDLYEMKNPAQEKVVGEVPGDEVSDKIMVKSEKRILQLDLVDIYFLESYGNYVKLWLKDSFHLTPRTLTSFVRELPEKIFLKVHKSFIVQVTHIDYIEGNQIFLRNGKTIPIGKNFRSVVKDRFS